MADFATIIAAAVPLQIDEVTAAALGEALMEGEDHGFEVRLVGDGALILAEAAGSEEVLPPRFLTLLGQVLSEAGLPHLEFGAAMICSKMLPDSHGGYSFRITSSGRLVRPKLDWSQPEKDERAGAAGAPSHIEAAGRAAEHA